MSVDYAAVLTANYPGAQWTLNGDTYDGLEWLDDSPKPSQKELDAQWAEVQAELLRKQVEDQRKAAYMAETDPLFFQYQRGDVTEQEWLDAVQAVKDRFPYPA